MSSRLRGPSRKYERHVENTDFERSAALKYNTSSTVRGRAIKWVVALVMAASGVLVAMNGFSSERDPYVTVHSDKELHANRTVKGDASAKVKLVEYGDFL